MDEHFHHTITTRPYSIARKRPEWHMSIPLQRRHSPQHDLPPHTQDLHLHLLHPFCLADSPDVRHSAFSGSKITRTGNLEAHPGVLPAGISTGACGKDGFFACREGRVGDGEYELVARVGGWCRHYEECDWSDLLGNMRYLLSIGWIPIDRH